MLKKVDFDCEAIHLPGNIDQSAVYYYVTNKFVLMKEFCNLNTMQPSRSS